MTSGEANQFSLLGTPFNEAQMRALFQKRARELAQLAEMWRSGHPEVMETMGRRVAEMGDLDRIECLLTSVAMIAGLTQQIADHES